ncbi:MAG: hypothetical protein AB7K04_01080 [Pseudorhodoplanes sp.]
MTGYTYGQADDALESFLWTESVLGHGHDLLRMADRLRPSSGWPSHSVDVNAGVAIVDLPGCPAYGFAARLADLAKEISGHSAAEGLGIVEVAGAFGGWVAPYIAYRLARGNQHAAVLWRPGSTPPEGEAPSMLVVAAPAGMDKIVPPLLVTPGAIDARGDGIVAGRGSIPARALEQLQKAIRTNRQTSALSIVTLRNTGAEQAVDMRSAINLLKEAGLPDDLVSLDASSRLRGALQNGMQVPPEDFKFLNSLAQRIRLPNTERSKAQAG